MSTKHLFLAIYSIVIFYFGFLMKGCFSDENGEKPLILADTALYERWEERSKTLTAAAKRKQVKPVSIKHQTIDSNAISGLEKISKIIEIRKNDRLIDVLSYQNSQMMESSYLSGARDFRISASDGSLLFVEEKKFVSFNGFRGGLGGKIDFKSGDKLFYIEAGAEWRILEKLDMDIRINSLPELALRINYTFY